MEQGHDMMVEPFHDMPYDGQHIMNRGAANCVAASLCGKLRITSTGPVDVSDSCR